jgi:hypothetical protein
MAFALTIAAVVLTILSAACQAPDGGSVPAGGSAPAAVDPAAGDPSASGTAGSGGMAQMATAEPGSMPSQVVIASTDLAVGPQRFAFALMDAYSAMVQNADATVTFFRIEGESATPVQTGPAKFYPSALEPAGTYVIYTDFEGAGVWGAEIAPTLPGGEAAPPLRVRFNVAQISASPAVGDIPPPLANRTLATEPELAKLTSDPNPDPEMYQMTVDEARTSGKPTVVLFSTPGYCQSKICGPVMDEVKTLKAKWGDRFNFIHVEVYQSFDPLVFADAMAAWSLVTEPWVYVLDKDGRVAERLEGSATVAEMEPILARVENEE